MQQEANTCKREKKFFELTWVSRSEINHSAALAVTLLCGVRHGTLPPAHTLGTSHDALQLKNQTFAMPYKQESRVRKIKHCFHNTEFILLLACSWILITVWEHIHTGIDTLPSYLTHLTKSHRNQWAFLFTSTSIHSILKGEHFQGVWKVLIYDKVGNVCTA
jgi:hypothetical protein